MFNFWSSCDLLKIYAFIPLARPSLPILFLLVYRKWHRNRFQQIKLIYFNILNNTCLKKLHTPFTYTWIDGLKFMKVWTRTSTWLESPKEKLFWETSMRPYWTMERPDQSTCHTRIILYPKKKRKSGSIGPITDRQGVHPGNRLPVPYRLGAGTQLARHIDRLSAACTWQWVVWHLLRQLASAKEV